MYILVEISLTRIVEIECIKLVVVVHDYLVEIWWMYNVYCNMISSRCQALYLDEIS